MSQSSQTTVKTKNELIDELKTLKQICSVCGCREYLSNFFNDLKNDVEIEILSKQLGFNPNQPILFHRKLIELRQQIIDRIDSFESKTNAHEKDEHLASSIAPIKERINSIVTTLNLINENNSTMETTQLDQIREAIESEESNIFRHLFNNKTIAFVNVEQLVGESKRELIDFKLVVVRDEYISNKALKQRQEARNQCIQQLNKHLVQIIRMEDKLKTEKDILEISLNLHDLPEFNLDSHRIIKLGAKCFQDLYGLQELILSRNKIVQIDTNTFTGLHNLHVLDLSNNLINLQCNSSAFKYLDSLKELNLESNQINKLNSNIFEGLVSLQLLRLNRNKIKEVDSNAFSGLKNLQFLFLEANQIIQLKENDFEGLASLKELWLSGNPGIKLNANAFSGLANLKTLMLAGNKLNEINLDVFKCLSNLRVLNLVNNLITELKENQFDGLYNLQDLWLQKNIINKVNETAFEGLHYLQHLDLNQNQISQLTVNTFEGLLKLQIVNVSRNKLSETIAKEFQENMMNHFNKRINIKIE